MTTKTSPNRHALVSRLLRQETYDVLGVELDIDGLSLSDISDWTTLKTVAINPRMCGPLWSMFAEVHVTVIVGFQDDTLYTRYEFAYIHHDGGSNGHTVRRQQTLDA